MWLFTRTGFYSVVDDPAKPHHFLVRARVRADLERLAAEAGVPAAVNETPTRDYRFRMHFHKADFVKAMVDQMMELDYTNVKDAIDLDEPERHAAMLRVWSAMYPLQPPRPYDENRWGYPRDPDELINALEVPCRYCGAGAGEECDPECVEEMS